MPRGGVWKSVFFCPHRKLLMHDSVLTGCDRLDDETVLAVQRSESSRVAYPSWKRALDVTLILLSAPLWLPLMLGISLVILIASRGPVIFRQPRVGYNGRPFLCYKFRSMRCDADARVHRQHLDQIMKSGAPMVKLDRADDPRLIPYGDLLRASGLDELPQVFNVLRGEMSLVGPRPCTAYEYELYLPWQRERFRALPGLTGLWQVSGKNRTTFEEMVRLDIRYRRELSLRQDLRIILSTFAVLCRQVSESAGRRYEKARALLSLRKTDLKNG